MRVLAKARLGVWQLNFLKQAQNLFHSLFLWHRAVDLNDLGHLIAHAVNGVERGQRLLKNHRNPVAANFLHLQLGKIRDVVAVEPNLTVFAKSSVLGQHRHDSPRRDGFARTGFTDDRQGFPARDFVRQAAHSIYSARNGLEVDHDVFDFQQRISHWNTGPLRRANHRRRR